ncbi:cellulase family glycosylhydrolase [Glycomyces sp. A-F 0318]|uniref:cellulase family glycosylhydrolase n=1 Tax=Glycomyces amatae TaxID=2881355 RepID=UPI001E55D606|nr:cellulase family glycosylhydrolase [Glycomyces amatae]MCD0442724.1 cellulase family glycosylhydrolase [Glycomyces amatae]
MENGTTDAAPARRRRMRRWLMAATAALAMAVAGVWQLAPAGAQQGGFSIDGTQLIDANGNPFIMRGTSHADVWYQGEFASYGEISDLGANTVRVVLGSGQRGWGTSSADRVADIIDECKAHQLICMLEVHDTTGYGEQSGAATLAQAVDYWQSIQSVLEGQEAYVLINIGNEPWGNQNASGWTAATTDAIQEMRSSGFDHTLVVDAPNWGQDWEGIMRSNAPAVAAADSQGNTLFSVHMYEVYGSAQTVVDYFDAFEDMNLPLIVGEYGYLHNGQPVAWETVQSEANARGIGWLAWSYSGNGSGVEYLDQVTGFDPNQLTSWGEQVFDSQYGIGNTAERASIFGDDPGPTTEEPTTEEPTTDGPTEEPGEGDCTATISVANDWGSGWQGNVTVTAAGEALDGWRLTWTWPGSTRITSSWNATVTSSGAGVTAVDVGWNGSVAGGQSREVFGFIASTPATAPTVTCEAV